MVGTMRHVSSEVNKAQMVNGVRMSSGLIDRCYVMMRDGSKESPVIQS